MNNYIFLFILFGALYSVRSVVAVTNRMSSVLKRVLKKIEIPLIHLRNLLMYVCLEKVL